MRREQTGTSHPPRSRARGSLLALTALLALALLAPAARAGDGTTDRTKVKAHPAHLDAAPFLELVPERGFLVEITLEGRILDLLVRRAIKRHDKDLHDVLAGLIAMNAVIAEVSDRSQARDRIAATVKTAEQKGWQRFVRVREDEGEYAAYVHTTKNEEEVDGLLVLGFTDEDQMVFVNLVGEIDMERIAMLGERFGVPGLVDLPPKSKVEAQNRKKKQDQDPGHGR